jgi:transposase
VSITTSELEGLSMKVTRGMQRKAVKAARRAALVGADTLIAGIDLAKTHSVVVFVRASDKAPLGRLRIPTAPAGLVELEARGRELMRRTGLSRLMLGMEATGHYWKILARAADELELPYVIVQSFVVARSRELDDLTRNKNDQRDALLIGQLVAEHRFTEVELERGAWAELRLLAEARDQRRVERTAALSEQRALLELVWPELLEQVSTLAGTHLQACLRLGLTAGEIAGMSLARFARLLQREHGERRFRVWMAKRLWAAARASRAHEETSAAMLRVQLAAQRIQAADLAVATLDARMTATFETTGLGWMRGQIRGIGDVLLINLLALSGDPRRFDVAGCMVKLAGSNPTERSSGQVEAAGGIPRRGRRTLRVVAHQAAVCLIQHNPDFEAFFRHLTQRGQRRLVIKAAQVAVANKLMRIVWAMATSGRAYDSRLATQGRLTEAA